ncbi:hypothetical protein ABUE38_09645 [Pediococcus parvulus]|uniref:Uncharacterized protein n=1 Tax=Pediococcus parvulus TaxID=54062 RepID=A0AAP5TEF7_9LACO|nr:hypothetical protein [Pediococcus parvulus]MCT3031877.1 hypothetical protein [Pediococcus parvulus]MDN5575653.1 hypothetical protein [Pediococcus sp.]MDV7694584.1 hypothetical protein [Pediococcus parvulus]OAD64767.1 hypothetical protein A7K95_02960 [Pediococcus parvulus]
MDTIHLEKLNELQEVIERRTISRFEQIADMAQTIDQTDICSETTFYIHDTSHWSTDYNSIVFDAHRGIHKTKMTTKKLINRYARSKEANFLLMQAMGRQLSVNRCWPYVLGSIQFAPTGGPVKDSTHWVAVHHMKDIYKDPADEKRIYIVFDGGYRLNVRVDFKTFHRKLEMVRRYYDFQLDLTKYLVGQFNGEVHLLPSDSYLATRIPRSPDLETSEYQNCREILIRIAHQVFRTMNPEDYHFDILDMEDVYKDTLRDKAML